MNDRRRDSVCENADLANAVKVTLEIGERRHASILVLAPVGRIDNLTSAEFQKRLLAAVSCSSADVIIDFSGVDYISSRGLHALMTASRRKSKEQRLAVARLTEVVHEIFSISRFTHLVPIFATIDEACAAWELPSPPKPAEPRTRTHHCACASGGLEVHCQRRCENLRYAARSETRCSRRATGLSTRRT
jgi:anti-anti-sigma factor